MPLDELLQDLLDPDKRPTAKQLSELSDLERDDLQALRETWEDIDPERRLQMVTDMAELAVDTVELNFHPVYKLALTDEDGRVRTAALKGLFEYQETDLIAPFIEMLREDEDEDVRREAAVALGRYALEAELGHIDASYLERLKGALLESAEDLDESDLVRARAIESAGAISGEDIENLIESIYQEDSIWLKVGAVDAMGRSANEVWLPVLDKESENPAPEMRHAAAFGMGEIGDEEAIPRLKLMAIEDPDREVQLAAIHSLGEIGGNKAKVALKSVLYKGDSELEEAVQEALTSLEDAPLWPGGV